MSKNESKSKKIYIRSMGKWIPVSEEYYQMHTREISKFREKMQDRGECRCTKQKWWFFDMDCLACEFRTSGRWLSMDMPMSTAGGGNTTLGDVLPDESPSIEEIIADRNLMSELFKALEELDEEGKTICKLISEGYSERASAEVLNLSRSTYKRRWEKIKKELSEKIKEFL